MTCNEIQELITIAVYGWLTPEEEARVKEHSATCPECAKLYAEIAPAVGHAIREPDFSRVDPKRVWNGIVAEAFPKPTQEAQRVGLWKWAFTAAGVMVVFVLGYLIGVRSSGNKDKIVTSIPAGIEAGSSPPLQRYVQSLHPVLTSFLDSAGNAGTSRLSDFDLRLIQDMRLQASLLKPAAAERGLLRLVELLDDLEIILSQLARIRVDDVEATAQLSRIIREKNILPRLRTWDVRPVSF